MRTASIVSLVFCLLSLAAAPTTTALPSTSPSPINPSDLSGHWEGSVQLPGKPLDVRVDFSVNAGKWSGRIDIPQQNASGLTLDPISVNDTQILFSIRGVPSEPTFNGVLSAGRIAGTFSQGPLNLPFSLGRGRVTEQHTRSQDPVLPLPYVEKQVAYESGPIQFAGTLTLPAGSGPFPAALLITGSGPQNRDEEVYGHRPFRVIADRLTRGGIAVLRVDDRGVGESTGGRVEDATTDDFAGDALAGVAFLKTRTEIAANRIGLIGHSEGGIIAPLAASRSKDVAFVVMLAGTGVPGDQVLVKQTELIARASGTDEAAVKRQTDELAEVLHAAESNTDQTVIVAKVRELAQHQNEALPPEKRRPLAELDAQADMEARSLTTPWFHFFLGYDPRPALRKVTVPVLALGGELDRQVSPEQNLPEIEKAVQEAGNGDVTVRRLPGLNHLFQTAHTGSPDEYAAIEETFNDAAIDLIKTWILKRFGQPSTQAIIGPGNR